MSLQEKQAENSLPGKEMVCCGNCGVTPERGPPGPPGPQGPAGSGSGGTMIPFASGAAVGLTTAAGGIANTVGLVGFGASTTTTVTGGTVVIAGAPTMALSMARAGTISGMAAYFSVSGAVDLGGVFTVQAQVYQSTAPNDTFTAVPGAVVTLSPTFTGTVGIGSIVFGAVTGLSIPVALQTRLMLVFSVTATGEGDVATLPGYAGGGVTV